MIDTTATIETPERVRFRYRLAGPGQRLAAWLLDLLAQFAFGLVLFWIVFASFSVGLEGYGAGVYLLGLFVLQWLYGVIFETALSGRTPGKAALSLRVVRADGSPGQFPDFLLRNLLRGIDALPAVGLPTFGIGVLTMAIDPRLRRLGDLVAGTVVVSEDKAHMLGSVAIEPPVSEEERQAMPPAVHLTNEELQVIEAFLRRRRRLSDERAEELASYFGPLLAKRTGIEAATAERTLTLAYARATGRDRSASEAG